MVRWGGEEFLILTPEVELDGALQLAEKLRKAVDEYIFETANHITISLSVAQKNKKEKTEEFIKRIDDLLYESKYSGRNKISS